MENNQVKKVKEKLDIVDIIKGYIQVYPAGRNYKALCPFHEEKTPSFIVSPERQTWHCFGECSDGGDVISFVMKYENVDFYTALKNLADKAGVQLKKIDVSAKREIETLSNIQKSAKDFFVMQLSKNEDALNYLKSRKLEENTIKEFELGFSPNAKDLLLVHLLDAGYDVLDIEKSGLIFKTRFGNYMDRFGSRIIFPIHNTFGSVIGFTGRILPKYDDGNVAKYINSPDTPLYHKSKILYGYHLSKKYIRESRSVIVVEGNMDAIMLWQDGVKNSVAVSGTALTKDSMSVLKRVADNFIFAFDNDRAGSSANEKAINLSNELDVRSSILLFADEKDPADFVVKNPGKASKYIPSHTISAMDFYFNKYLYNLEKQKPNDVKENIKKVLERIKIIYSPMEKQRWIKELSEKTGIKESVIGEEIELLDKRVFNKNIGEKDGEIKSAYKFSSRLDNIAEKILRLAVINNDIFDCINGYVEYFSEKMLYIYNIIKDNKNEKQADEYIENISCDDLNSIAMRIDMTASLENFSKDEAYSEAVDLLEELKREFFKIKSSELHTKIRIAEKEGDSEKVKILLEEFYKIVKLINK